MGTRAGAARGTDRYQAAREKAMRRPGVDLAERERKEAAERARLIKLIHVGRRDLQIDDSTWRSYLQAAFSCSSSTELSLPRLRTAMEHLKRRGFTPKTAGAAARQPHEWPWVDSVTEDRAPLLRKIIKQMQQTDVTLGNQMCGGDRQADGRSQCCRRAGENPQAAVDVLHLRADDDRQSTRYPPQAPAKPCPADR